jgi:tetratricopeptide (TPR) repeat protein
MAETPMARGRFEQALSLYRESGNRWGTARGLTNLGGFELGYGDRAAARTLLEEGVAILDELGDQFMLTYPLCQHAELAFVAGDYMSARTYVERSLAGSREIRDPEGVATALTLLGQVLQTQGDYAAARACLAEVMAFYRARGSPIEAAALCGLVETAIAVGDLSTGRLHLLEVAGLTAAVLATPYICAILRRDLAMIHSDHKIHDLPEPKRLC